MEREQQSARSALQRADDQQEIQRMRERIRELEAVVVGLGQLLVESRAKGETKA